MITKNTKVFLIFVIFMVLLFNNLYAQKMVEVVFINEVGKSSFLNNSQTSIANQGNNEISNSFICVSISPFLLYGGSLGFGKYFVNKDIDRMNENIWIIHYNQAENIALIEMTTIYDFGVYYQKNCFISTNRNGLFGLLIYGIDCMVQKKNKKTTYTPCPNLAVGGGYSVKLSKDTFLRISLDIGIKCLWTNLNLTIIF